MIVFWVGTLFLLLCAGAFVVPILWLAPTKKLFTTRVRLSISSALLLLLILGTYSLYYCFGAGEKLAVYLHQDNVINRENYQQLRPLYARLQRELIKNKLALQLDLANVDLILHFATIYSQAQQGILPVQIQELLQSVLRVAPQQATALNLLAIHFFKRNDYAQAINYWQQILDALGPNLQTTSAAKVLQDKIAECKAKLV